MEPVDADAVDELSVGLRYFRTLSSSSLLAVNGQPCLRQPQQPDAAVRPHAAADDERLQHQAATHVLENGAVGTVGAAVGDVGGAIDAGAASSGVDSVATSGRAPRRPLRSASRKRRQEASYAREVCEALRLIPHDRRQGQRPRPQQDGSGSGIDAASVLHEFGTKMDVGLFTKAVNGIGRNFGIRVDEKEGQALEQQKQQQQQQNAVPGKAPSVGGPATNGQLSFGDCPIVPSVGGVSICRGDDLFVIVSKLRLFRCVAPLARYEDASMDPRGRLEEEHIRLLVPLAAAALESNAASPLLQPLATGGAKAERIARNVLKGFVYRQGKILEEQRRTACRPAKSAQMTRKE